MKIIRALNPNEILIENCLDEEINITDTDEDGNVINRNFDLYQGKKVIFRNCPNAKIIKAECLQLQGLKLENCPQLEELSAYHNNLTGLLDLRQCPKLKTLNVPYNQLNAIELSNQTELETLNVRNNNLTKLVLRNNSKIKTLICSYNKIRNLRINHCKDLKKIECENNLLESLEFIDLPKLEHISCFGNFRTLFFIAQGLNKLVIKNCKSLKFLDCGENSLERLILKDHPELEQVSVKGNNLEALSIEDCPKLGYLDFSLQGDYIIDQDGLPSICSTRQTYYFTDKQSCQSLERVKFGERTKTYFIEGKQSIPFNPKEDFKYFPKLTDFGVSNIDDDPDFEAWLDKKKEEREAEEQRKLREANPLPTEDENYDPDPEQKKKKNDEIPLCPWVLPTSKANIKKIDLPHKHLMGKLIIADYPDLTFINVGNNDLEALIIRNCPQLKRLIYAHNNLRESEAEISGCPKLTSINNYKCQGGWERPEMTDEEKEAFQNQLNEEWGGEEGSSQENQDKILAQIICLIGQAETALEKKDYQELARLVTKIKQLAKQEIQGLNKTELQAKINKWEQALTTQNNVLPQPNYWPVIIFTTTLFLIPLAVWLVISKWVKKKIK